MRRPRTLRGQFTPSGWHWPRSTIVVLTVASTCALSRSADSDANSRLRSQAAAARRRSRCADGRIIPREAPDDAAIDREVWIYAGSRGARAAGREPGGAAAADALAGRAHVSRDLPKREFRLYAAAADQGGRQIGTVVAAMSLAPTTARPTSR